MFYLLSKTHRTRCPTVPPGCGAFFLGKLFKCLFCFNWRHSGKINIWQVLCWLKLCQACEIRTLLIFDRRAIANSPLSFILNESVYLP
jgi:hypothetical protein